MAAEEGANDLLWQPSLSHPTEVMVDFDSIFELREADFEPVLDLLLYFSWRRPG